MKGKPTNQPANRQANQQPTKTHYSVEREQMTYFAVSSNEELQFVELYVVLVQHFFVTLHFLEVLRNPKSQLADPQLARFFALSRFPSPFFITFHKPFSGSFLGIFGLHFPYNFCTHRC